MSNLGSLYFAQMAIQPWIKTFLDFKVIKFLLPFQHFSGLREDVLHQKEGRPEASRTGIR